MAIEVAAHFGVDDGFIAWRAPFTPDCRGFSLRRRIKRAAGSQPSPHATPADEAGFVEEIVSSWVGFGDGGETSEGERRPTTEWPIQRYLWTDYTVSMGDVVSYRVTPVVGREGHLREASDLASNWTEPGMISADCGNGMSCFFNRGIVASQWLARLLPPTGQAKKLTTIINSPGDRTRNFLGGPERDKLIALLEDVIATKRHVYAVLYELDDRELEELLSRCGKRAHIVLGNGSVKTKGADQNRDARETLTPVCDVHDRMTSPRALAHNKFIVFCDANKQPAAVWTGSMNWTKTGLCTQANNSVYIENPELAKEYRKQWEELRAAGDASPETMKDRNEEDHRMPSLPQVTLWFTPMREQSDLLYARQKILGAKQGVLFVMFNPGPMGTLLNVIIERASPNGSAYDPDLYVQGVVNQDPSTTANPVILFHRNDRIDANADVVLPAAIDARLKYWLPELLKLPTAFAMVHSKVIVVDPFSEAPVVMTGSHNLGPKASGVNDENFLIIEGNRSLAAKYASNIMAIYGQYRWRWRRQNVPGADRWQGLIDADTWQIDDRRGGDHMKPYDRRRLREVDFWLGLER